MALLELDAAAAEELIAGYDGLTVAVYASPRQTVIAGPPDQVDAAIAVVSARTGWPAGWTSTSRRTIGSSIRSCPSCGPRWPGWRRSRHHPDPQHRRRRRRHNIIRRRALGRQPAQPGAVRRAVAAAAADNAMFIEISPHPLLGYAIKDTLGDTHHHALGTLARDTHDTVSFHTALNTTHTPIPPTPNTHPDPTPTCPPPPGTTPATGSPPTPPPHRREHTRCWASA